MEHSSHTRDAGEREWRATRGTGRAAASGFPGRPTPAGTAGRAPRPDPRAVTDREWMEALGRRLERLRDARGLTQVEAAERAALSRKTIHRAERGENPTLLTVTRLLRVYDRLDLLEALVPEDPGVSPVKRLAVGRRSTGAGASDAQAPPAAGSDPRPH